jgi:hypothetical protein
MQETLRLETFPAFGRQCVCLCKFISFAPHFQHPELLLSGIDLKGLAFDGLSSNARPFTKIIALSGPDEIRTRDLGLDRAACLAATPRDHLLSGR